ncbi:hypothetical protein FAM18157_00183 [Lacticaseibacillus paracasei]|jgi:hypothetical protein|uniref:Uncharacterized protein n=1 Tax=Lacticaseibacillus paracasei TaxID=1597 RepID=A0A422M8N1_LACPA|nr:hypothetical protein CDA65_02609 [Lacticaseibacillus paracasei]RND84430.1 hypothetical protein FAM18157_00183 [Lacticaseibacillus paracasei]
MTTVILAEKPSQARSYVQDFQKSTKSRVTIRLVTLFCPKNTKLKCQLVNKHNSGSLKTC